MFPLRLALAKLSILKISGYHESLFPQPYGPVVKQTSSPTVAGFLSRRSASAHDLSRYLPSDVRASSAFRGYMLSSNTLVFSPSVSFTSWQPDKSGTVLVNVGLEPKYISIYRRRLHLFAYPIRIRYINIEGATPDPGLFTSWPMLRQKATATEVCPTTLPHLSVVRLHVFPQV
jgi:hypothetical protein